MKDSLKVGLKASRTVTVDESRCTDVVGDDAAVYATPVMVDDVEHTCHDMLLEHLDPGETSVGAHVSIDHLASTPIGLEVSVEVRIAEVDRRKVTWEFTVRDPLEEIGRGRHVRFVVEAAKTRERLAAKRAKLGR